MKGKIKYTSDGKKVVIIDYLNAQETIVQEIFIIEGKEVPSGKNFIADSLHDAPAISWKEQNLAELEKRFEKESKKWECEIEKKEREYRYKCIELERLIAYSAKALVEINPESFKVLSAFLSGKITHIVEDDWSGPKIVKYEDFNKMYERNLKLITIFGNIDRSINYGINCYSDGSGSNKYFYPFTNYKDAFKKFKELLLNEHISEKVIELASKHKIKLDETKIREWKEESIKSFTANIALKESEISKEKENIEKIQKI